MLDVLETTRGRDAATERVLALLRRARCASSTRTVLTPTRRRLRGLAGRDGGARQAGAGRAVGPPSFIARFSCFVALLRRPATALEMMWRRDRQAEARMAALRAFSDPVVTVQRQSGAGWRKSVVIFEKVAAKPVFALIAAGIEN